MKCQKHPNEVGVCASCLRERLLAVIAARSAASSPSSPDDHRHPHLSYVEPEQPSPQPFSLPRSVSPYVSRLRSDGSNIGRFPDAHTGTSHDARLARSGKFSVFSTLFGRHRSENSHRDHGPAARIRRSRSWIPALIRAGLVKRRDKKKKKAMTRFISAAAPSAATVAAEARPRASLRRSDRGMSLDRGDSAPESGYITDFPSPGSAWWRPTPSPLRQRPTAEHQHHFSGGLAGFAVCLSPLMRPSPTRRRYHVGAEISGCDLPRTLSPLHHQHHGHASGGRSSLCSNRSRKLADSSKFK